MTMLAPPPIPLPTAAPTVARPLPGPVITAAGPRVLLPHVSWATYLALLADVGDGAARMTYDNGWLEIEMPGRTHELNARFVGEMVTAVLKRQRIAYEPSGAATWQRADLLRGLEADECYHIQSLPLVVGRDDLDLAVDPPPDLAIEVEVSSPLLDKVAVYAAIGVPEVWRVRADGTCDILRRDAAGAYQPAEASGAVPPFTAAVVTRYVQLRLATDYHTAMTRFEAEFLVAAVPA